MRTPPRTRARQRRLQGLLAGLVTTGLLLTGCSDDPSTGGTGGENAAGPSSQQPSPTKPAGGQKATGKKPADGRAPNIVLVLMDDFSADLLPSVAQAAVMAERGATYQQSFVVDSLCCVSRTAVFTGQYPHQNGVRTNTSQVSDERGPLGGWPAFRDNGNLERTFAHTLQKAGMRTGFVGKYINEYEYNPGWKVPQRPTGWDQFNVVFGSAYDGWGFDSTTVGDDGQFRTVHHPTPAAGAPEKVKDASYAGTVIEDYALDFIETHSDGDRPYFLEVAPYAPHSRTNDQGAWPREPFFPAAFADRRTAEHRGNCGPVPCPSLQARTLPGFGDDPADNRPLKADGTPARAWNPGMPQDPVRVYSGMRAERAQMAQSVDRMLEKILAAVDEDTYVFFTSDNGFHLGQLGLGQGKGTAYDTDVRVPLFVVGPGVQPGERAEWTSNIDLASTFEELAGARTPAFRAGRSLVPSLADPALRTRTHVYFEHTSEPGTKGDPDRVRNGYENDRIPSYVAVRGDEGLLVRNDLRVGRGEPEYGYEYYPYDEVAWERTNEFANPRYADKVAALRERLTEFDSCRRVRNDAPVPPRCRG